MSLALISEILLCEQSSARPSDEVCKKIKELNGLLDFNTFTATSWRKPNIQISNRIIRNDSFNSLGNNNHSPLSQSTSLSSARSSPAKYVSKYKNSEQQIEDKILNTIILSKLNKFSSSTYEEIRNFLYQILGSSSEINTKEKENIEEFVKEFMNLVFKKGASEEIFCPLYAKLLGEISEKYPIIIDEMNRLLENYLEIFEESDDNNIIDYEAFLVKNREKKYRQGYSQFIAELTSLRIISADKLIVIFEKIIQQICIQGINENKLTLNEQYIDCLLRISKVLRKKVEPFYVNIRLELFKIVDNLYNIIDNNKDKYISLSAKSKYLLMDILDYLKGL